MSAFDQTPLRPDAPAMPTSQEIFGGLTARQHAAIALCVPDSGCDWLDDMIRMRNSARLRDEFAGKAMQALLMQSEDGVQGFNPDQKYHNTEETAAQNWARKAYEVAKAMLAARRKG